MVLNNLATNGQTAPPAVSRIVLEQYESIGLLKLSALSKPEQGHRRHVPGCGGGGGGGGCTPHTPLKTQSVFGAGNLPPRYNGEDCCNKRVATAGRLQSLK